MFEEKQNNSNDKIKIGPKNRVGLVCSGGGSKAAAFHLGVAMALQEQGFHFIGGPLSSERPVVMHSPMDISIYVGSSAGSLISTYLASGYSVETIFTSLKNQKPKDPIDQYPKALPRMTYQKMFKIRGEIATEQIKQFIFLKKIFSELRNGSLNSLMRFRWLKTTGFFSTSGIEQYLREEVLPTNAFKELAADLFIVATNLNHSRKVVFGKYQYQPPPHDLTCQFDNDANISQACAASSALPFIFAPYPIESKTGNLNYYIDGEIRDTLSTHVAIDAGADLVIASHTHQPYHFTEKTGSLTQYGLPLILIQSIYLLVEQKINNAIHNKNTQRNALLAVSDYCKKNDVSEFHRKKILDILESELHHRLDVDTILIHPEPSDDKMFIYEHFSLSPKRLAEIVKCGFDAASKILKKYDFADRKNSPPIGQTQSVP